MSKNIETLKLADIVSTTKTQTRAAIDKEALAEYTRLCEEAKAKGAAPNFPPLLVYRDIEGTLRLSGGFTRRQALIKAGIEELACEVREGDENEAIVAGFKDNLEHGVRLHSADLQHNLNMALKLPGGAELTNTALADMIGASEAFVRKHRPAAAAPAKRTAVDKKTGEKRTVTATRNKKDKDAPTPEKPAKGKKGKKGKDAKPDADKPKPEDKELTKAVEKIAGAIDGHGYKAAEFKAGITDGSLPLSAAELKKWAATSAERIKNSAALVIGQRWSVAKAFAFLDKQPDESTKADHFINSAIAHGGIVHEVVGTHKFIVFDTERFTAGEDAKGNVTITPKAAKRK